MLPVNNVLQSYMDGKSADFYTHSKLREASSTYRYSKWFPESQQAH